nr:hypothetical protein [Tanacetum cinerariifolium]
MEKQLPEYVPNAVADFVKPCLEKTMIEVMKTNQINLFITPSTTSTDDLTEMELKIKLYNRMFQNRSFETHGTHQQLHNILFDFITLVQENLNTQDTKPTLKKIPHDDQDPPNNLEDMIQKHPNPEWFPDLKDKLVMDANKESNGEDELTKPQSLEMKMSKSTKLDSYFYNNEFYYLAYVNMEKKHASSLTKHYAARYYFKWIEDMISDRWCKEVHKYHVQGKLHHQKLENENDFINAILHNIQRVVIKNKIEDTQLENLQKMLKENRLGCGNVNLKGREWTVNDLKRSKEMLESIEKTLKHIEQTRRLEEYVGGRPTTIDLCSFVRP